MKLLIISEYFPPESKGGGELSAFSLAKELAKKIEVHVLTSHFKNLKKEEICDNVHIHRYLTTGADASIKGNISRTINFEKSLLEELERFPIKIDIVHCMNTTSIVAAKLKEKLKVPFVLHVNGPLLFCPKGTLMYKDKELCDRQCSYPTYIDCLFGSKTVGKVNLSPFLKYNPVFISLLRRRYTYYQKLMKKFDHFMAISTFMKEQLIKDKIDPRKITLVYNIMDLSKYSNLKKPKNKIKKILYLGGYDYSKGPSVLIDALKNIKHPFSANFYGEGILKEKLQKEIQKNSLQVSIHDKVSNSEVPKIMAEHDLIVFPSMVGEAFGRVALEARAAGKTVVASNIGGITDIIEDKKTGFLFRPGDSTELKQIIEKILSGTAIATEICTKKSLSKFSKDKSIKDALKIYIGLAKSYK
ncbi:MAG: glycosyltransferase family 4 protein [archaeon]